ncbi:hypothetical protein G6716_04895 [Polynucleobacter paneuropaeus]|nr:hypothetical protein G6716_04895 [Polynucleobacter paneuropaeus]
MSLGTLLRAAAIIGACIWTIFLIRGWSAYSDMQAFRGGMYEKVISDAFQSLTIQTIVVFLLFLGGIFIKGSSTQEESSSSNTNESPNSNNSTNSTFSGEPLLTNDAYKIFLTNKYGIQKNDALGKYIIQEKLFDSIDEALKFAANAEESIKINKEKEDQLKKAQAAEERQKEADYLNSSEYKKKKILKVIGALVLFAALFSYIFINFNSGKSQQSQIAIPSVNDKKASLNGIDALNGKFSNNPNINERCSKDDDKYPIFIEGNAMSGYESSCKFTNIQQADSVKFLISEKCRIESQEVTKNEFFVITKDGLLINGKQFYRCQ